jgi:hypothetical protein
MAHVDILYAKILANLNVFNWEDKFSSKTLEFSLPTEERLALHTYNETIAKFYS